MVEAPNIICNFNGKNEVLKIKLKEYEQASSKML